MRVMVIGLGRMGVQVVNQLLAAGHEVVGVSRRPRPQLTDINHIQADMTTLATAHFQHIDRVLVMVTPDDYSEAGYYSTFVDSATTLAPKIPDTVQRVVFVSSTGIYGRDDGGWVDSQTAPNPSRYNGSALLQAEQVWQQHLDDRACVIRPSGIYGVDRLMMLNWVRQQRVSTTPHWSNRIMDTDLATIICRVLTVTRALPLYLATDYQPVERSRLLDWLSVQLDLPPVPKQTLSVPTGKRIHSNIPLEWLNYPDWQSGYQRVVNTCL